MLGYRKPMTPNSHLLIIFSFIFLSVQIASGDGTNDDHQAETVRLDLMHRHHPQVADKLDGDMKVENIHDRIKDIHDHDRKRHRTISASVNRKAVETKVSEVGVSVLPPPSSTAIGLKMFSGADYGSSEYFVGLKVGTPPQSMTLIADTGSDLTWIKCRYRRCVGNCSGNATHKIRNERKVKWDHLFFANHSSSFRTIDCNSKACTQDFATLFSLKDCKTPTSPCRYQYSYTGGATAGGLFALETLTVNLTDGKEKQLKDALIGCTESAQGKIFNGADGVLGLGTSVFSFAYKAAQNAHGGGFSYCLVDHLTNRSAISYFVLGPPSPKTSAATSSVPPTGKASVTKLFLGQNYRDFYGVLVVGISIDGVTLNIPPRVWDINAGGGTILDSGTSLTILTTPAYDMVVEALIQKLKFEKIKIDPFEFCFNDTLYEHQMAPKLRFHFGDGSIFEPPAKSYVISIGEHISCLGFVAESSPATNILGNIIQQNFLWQFDFFKGYVSFTPSECV